MHDLHRMEEEECFWLHQIDPLSQSSRVGEDNGPGRVQDGLRRQRSSDADSNEASTLGNWQCRKPVLIKFHTQISELKQAVHRGVRFNGLSAKVSEDTPEVSSPCAISHRRSKSSGNGMQRWSQHHRPRNFQNNN